MAIEKLLSLLATHLRGVADNIDAGNSNLTEDEAISLLDSIRRITDREVIMSKYEACKYLNMSRSSFDNHVRAGRLPKGEHRAGFKTIVFKRKDLDEFVKRYKKTRGNENNGKICNPDL